MTAPDPERLLLEIAIQRGVMTPQGARDVYAAHRAQPLPGGLPEMLVRRGMDAVVVGNLKNEVTAQLRASRVYTAKDVRTPSRAFPRNTPAPLPALGSSTAPAPPSDGVEQSLYAAPPGPSSPETPFNPDGKTLVARSVTEAMYPAARLPTRRDAPSAVAPSLQQNAAEPAQTIRPRAGSRFGRYELLAEVGRGGMGVVFRARQPDLDRIVALKMLLMGEAAAPEERERFFSEARHAAKLAHRAIVAVHDVGEIDGIHYYTMDFVEGEDLGQRIKERGRLDPAEAVSIALSIAEGLGYAHDQGVIHRDLKPSNVLLDKAPGAAASKGPGRIRITDFGIAKDLDRTSTTRAGEVLGTPNYMPPEQADGRALEVDRRADIYSLGAVLYEMLTGRPPFEGKTGFAILSAVINEPPKPLRELVPALSADLEAIVMKCLEKDRANRYPKVSALVADLERFQEGGRIDAARPAKGGGGHGKLLAALVLVVVALLGGGLVYMRDLNARAEAAQREVERKQKETDEANRRAREAEAERAAAEKSTALVKEALEAVARDERDHAVALAVEAAERAPKLALAHATLARLYLELRQDATRAIAESDLALSLDATSLEARVTRARALVLQGKWSEALQDCEALAALGAEGKAAAARVRGDVLLAQRDVNGAIKELERAADLAPRDGEARVALARAYLLANRAEDAERVATAAREIDARLVAALLARAEARSRLGRVPEALEDANEAARLAPQDSQARALVEKLGATATAADGTSDQELHKRADAALAALQAGERAKVEAWLGAPRSPAECAYVLGTRGHILWRLGRYAEADEAYTALIKKQPRQPGGLTNRGVVREALERPADALADYDAALAEGIGPATLTAASNRARLLCKLGRYDEGEKAWEALLKGTQDTHVRAQAFHDRAKACWLPRSRFAEAESDLAEAIALIPNHGHFWRDRGDARDKKGDKAGAVADWKAALEGKQLSKADAEHVREQLRKAESPR